MNDVKEKLDFEGLIKLAGRGEDKSGKDLDVKNMGLRTETKADEVLSTVNNTNWYDAYGLINDIKDLTPKYGKVLAQLTEGFEGSELPNTYKVPYNITDYFMQGKSEWEDEGRPAFNSRTMTDSSSTITQKPLILQFGVSDRMIAHCTDKQLYEKLLGMLTKAYTRTLESMIINGDSEAGATGNVNSDDQAPATTFAADGGTAYHATLIDHGIREVAINGTQYLNVGAFDSDDMLGVVGKLGDAYQEDFENLLFISNPKTYTKMKTDDGFKLASSRNGAVSIDTGVVDKPWGIDMVVSPLVPKTEADGKVSATAANNTLGQFLAVVKRAIRWGYGMDFKLEVERVQGYGYQMTATVEFGFVILDSANSVALGYNMTI